MPKRELDQIAGASMEDFKYSFEPLGSPDEPFFKMQEEKLDKIVFYNCAEPTLEIYKETTSPANAIVVYMYSAHDELLGLSWVNGFMGQAAQIHFCVFEKAHAASKKLCAGALKYFFVDKQLSALIGITPRHYRHVFPMIYAVGFEKISELPGGCFISRKHKFMPAVITLLTRDNWLKAQE